MKNFKAAREIAYSNSTNKLALDSALYLANESMMCDSIRKAVVDFKITLYVAMQKYAEGISFIDSLSGIDFPFEYKRSFMRKGLQALEFDAKNDTVKRNVIYQEIVNDIEKYIDSKNDMNNKEFTEIYTDLFATKEKYLDASQVNREAEMLKSRYPNRKAFFELLKKD